ncbi:MAG: dockerin type I domain-containing protein [Clostridia bacterium]|nr:dockerin type I domain-containing protein [Clostridia bacterium]
MSRKILSVVMSVIIILTLIIPAATVFPFAVWSGQTSVPAVVDGVYQISTPEELAWFAKTVNSGTNSINAVLNDDISVNVSGREGLSFSEYVSDASFSESSVNQWTPIGTESVPFEGTFDGQGHTVSGLYINTTGNYVGLFGSVVNPVVNTDENGSIVVETRISNIKVTESYIKANQNVGGIAGYLKNAGIENCSFSGVIDGDYNSVGGVVGWAYADSIVNECKSEGTVSGNQRTGGIVGFASGNAVVQRCYSTAAVSGSSNVGGLVGTLSGSDLNGSFFKGAVSASDRVGGLVGYSAFGNMASLYSIASVSCEKTNRGAAVGVTYGGNYKAIYYSYETSGCEDTVGSGKTLEEMQTAQFVKELNNGFVYFCYDYTTINNSNPVLTWMLETDVWLGDYVKPKMSDSGIYQISRPSELAWFAALVNGTLEGVDANPAANAVVTNDLLLNINVYDSEYGVMEWTPIGTADNPYTGNFNGGGYNIAGVYTTVTSGDDGSNVGLFGNVSGGAILNTIVVDGLIVGIENVGGIVGSMSNGIINNCCSNSDIRGDKAVGGIVGKLTGSSSQITASCSIGTVTGTTASGDASYAQNVGGLIGYNNRAEISKCFTYGSVNAPSSRNVGGLIGNNAGGKLTLSYNAATVNASVAAGGLVGYNNNGTVNHCYTVEKVTANSQSGIAFGYTSGSNVSDCYYDKKFAAITNTTDSATGCDSDFMTGTAGITNMGLSTSEWKGTASDEYFYYYPQLLNVASSSVGFIKSASLMSVRRVQDKYVARVELDGRSDRYFESIDDALTYIKGLETSFIPSIYIVKDITLDSTINIDVNTGLYGDSGAVVTRGTALTGPMLNVTANLYLSSEKYADGDKVNLALNGNSVKGTQSAIVVNDGAYVKIGKGISAYNFDSSSSGSFAQANSGGTLDITGGSFYKNKSDASGAVILNNEGIVNITGGDFNNNSVTVNGAVIDNENGQTNISGGSFTSNSADELGGAVYTKGVYAQTVISGTAVFDSNKATGGGALCSDDYATVEISGGTVTANRAYSNGGALLLQNGGEAVISGGNIESNTSDKNIGAGVYNNGSLTMKDAAFVNSDNEIYLPTGKTVTVTSALTASGYAATIVPEKYETGLQVLEGSAMSTNFTKFGLSDTTWYIVSTGCITKELKDTVAVMSKKTAYSVEYSSLADAFAAVSEGEDAIITLVADTTITSTIKVNGDVTIVSDDETYTAKRNGSFYGVLFDVQPGATLRFGDVNKNSAQQAQSDYAQGTATAGQFILDGCYSDNGVVGAAAVSVQSGGTFEMYDDAIIQDFKNTTTGTIVAFGNVNIYGGFIRDNISCYGGAVYVKDGGELKTYGGIINGNTSENGGDAVYALGDVTRNIHTYNYQYVEKIYDEDGNITGSKDPVLKGTSKSDIIIPDSSDVYLGKNVIYIEETSSDVFVTELSAIPDDTEFTPSVMTVDYKTYTPGAIAVYGRSVSNYYNYFDPVEIGFYVSSDGTFALDKIVTASGSGLTLNRDTSVVTGFDLSAKTVADAVKLFANDSDKLRFYSADGKLLTSTDELTTNCTVKLLDSEKVNVTDTVVIAVYGDVNCDYSIDGCDSVIIRAIAEGMLTDSQLTAAQLKAADINFDGRVTSADAEHTDSSGIFTQSINQG